MMQEGSLFSTCPQHLLYVDVLMIGTLISVRWYFIVVLIGFSIINSDDEHLFMGLLDICMHSLEKCLFRSSALFTSSTGLFGFCCYWVVWAFCIFLKLNPVGHIFCKHFLPVPRFSVLFMVFFAMKKPINLIRPHLFTFTFIYIASGIDLRKHWYDLCQRLFFQLS